MKAVRAKNFKVKDEEGAFFDLFDYVDDSWLLLIFFRGEWCQHCRKQLEELNENLDWFKKKKIKIVAVGADSDLYTSILKEILHAKFVILSDEAWKIFSLYGFKKPADQKKIIPALFLINPQHQVVFRYKGKHFRDRPTITQLKDICKKQI